MHVPFTLRSHSTHFKQDKYGKGWWKKKFGPCGIWTRGLSNMSKKLYHLSYRDIHTIFRLDVINKVCEMVASGSSSRFQQKLRYRPCLGCWPRQNLVFHWILTGPDKWEIDIKNHYMLAYPKLRKLQNCWIFSAFS